MWFVRKTRKDIVCTLKAGLYLPYLLCILTNIKPSPLLYLVWHCPKVLHSLDVCIWLLAGHEAIGISRQMLTLWLGKVPKHCCHNFFTKTINPPLERTNCKIMGDSTFLPCYLQKQCHPPAIPKINCTPADLWCQTVWYNQPTKTNLGPACLVWNSQQ